MFTPRSAHRVRLLRGGALAAAAACLTLVACTESSTTAADDTEVNAVDEGVATDAGGESNDDAPANASGGDAPVERSTAELPRVDIDGALRANVTRVPDGDSFEATIDGRDERIRMIGINTPEGDECFGDEAGDELRRLIDGREIDLVTPLGERDDFDRILAYVVADGELVNAALVRDGFAIARDQSGHDLAGDFETLEQGARDEERGVWSRSACGVPTVTEVRFGDFEPNAPGPDDENLNGEWIDITNDGSADSDLSGWTVKDESTRHRYIFDDGITLGAGDTIRLYTGCGQDGGGELYWCDQTSVWNNGGDTAFLLDTNGNIVDTIAY